jgi:hypothetical protein
MRPDPHHRYSAKDSGRIIYLGDVRRRRAAARRQAPDRYYLLGLLLLALAGWALWLTVFLAVPPARLLTYAAFCASLWIALGSTAAIAAYGIEWRLGHFPLLSVCLRRGALVASVVVLNLALLAAHHWLLPAGLVVAVAALMTELALTQRLR